MKITNDYIITKKIIFGSLRRDSEKGVATIISDHAKLLKTWALPIKQLQMLI